MSDGQGGAPQRATIGRRRLVAGLGAGLAAAIVGALGRAKVASADDHQALILGEDNVAQSPTSLGFASKHGFKVKRQLTNQGRYLLDSDLGGLVGEGVEGSSDAVGIFGWSEIAGSTNDVTITAHSIGVVGASQAIGVLGTDGTPTPTPIANNAGVVGSASALGVLGSGAIGVIGSAPVGSNLLLTLIAQTQGGAGVVGSAPALGVVGAGGVGVLGTDASAPVLLPAGSNFGVVGASRSVGVLGTGAGGVVGTANAMGTGVVGSAAALGILGSGGVGVLGTDGSSQIAVTQTAGAGVIGAAAFVGVMGVIGNVHSPGSLLTRPAGLAGIADSLGTAVFARNTDGGVALDVSGKARFSTAGRATIPAGQDSVAVPLPSVTPSSTITATPMSAPPPFNGVRWVERQPGIGFVVHLQYPTNRPLEISYLVTESPTSA